MPLMVSHPLSFYGYVSILWLKRYSVDAWYMSAALKLSVEELVHDGARSLIVDKPAGHHKHIGVVVLTDEVRNLRYPAETGPHFLMLVQRHGHAFAGAADAYSGVDLAFFNG